MSNLAGFIPTNLTVVQHSTRDITFILPKPVPEVGFLESNYEKRLSTATNWAKDRTSKLEKPLIDLENLPATGFSIETLNGRYRTEVEYICVRHPDGYVFEVPFQNLLDIIKEVGCGVGGIIDKPCYMFAMGGKWRLIPVGGDMDASAQEADKESRKFVADKKVNAKKKMSVGQVVKMRDYDGYWVYLGKHKVGIFGGGTFEFFKETRVNGHLVDIRSYKSEKFIASGNKITSNFKTLDGAGYEQESTRVFHSDASEPDYMVFVRIPNVSKTESITNEEFLTNSWSAKSTEPEMALFKSRSVQHQPTDEFDQGTVDYVLNGNVQFEIHSASNIPRWDFTDQWKGGERAYGWGGDYSYLLKAGEEPKLGEVVTKEQAKAISGGDRFWVDSVELWTPRVLDRQSPKFKFKIMKGV